MGLFPLGKTGGLIEALYVSNNNRHDLPRFRWVKPAASLKLARTTHRRVGASTGFRWVKPAASLKQGRSGILGSRVGGVSAG